MENLPSSTNELRGVYVIDRLKDGQIWYLWTIEDGRWILLKLGDWEQIMTKLKELKEGEGCS